MSSTKKTSRNLRWAKDSPGAVAAVADVVAVVDVAAADAAGAAVLAVERAAGAGPGVAATPARPRRFPATCQLGRFGRRPCSKLDLENGARLRRLRLLAMSVQPIEKRWRERLPGFAFVAGQFCV